MSSFLIYKLQKGLQQQSLDAKALIGGYGLMLHRQHETTEAVAWVTGLDRRTAKKHIETGKQTPVWIVNIIAINVYRFRV